MQIERRDVGLTEVKLTGDASKTGVFSGYGAVFGNTDSYGDVIERGAFFDTIREWQQRGKWPPMLLQHGGGMFGGGADDMLPIGQWTQMQENNKGLKVEGRLFAMDTERGKYIYEGLQSGALDGLSIGFMVREAINGTKPNEPARTLTNIDLWEVSVVTFPANPKARITGVKSLTPEQLRELEDALRDGGLSRTDSLKAVSVLKHWLQRDAGAPRSRLRDEALPVPSDAERAALQVAAQIGAASINPKWSQS